MGRAGGRPIRAVFLECRFHGKGGGVPRRHRRVGNRAGPGRRPHGMFGAHDPILDAAPPSAISAVRGCPCVIC